EKVEAAIKNVPYAVGINNHMGSKITGDKRIMGVILEVCKEHGLFFVDSKTNYHSIVGEICDEKGMPRLQNHIFLDDVHSVSHVTGQLRKVQERLQQQSPCVTIGHVGVGGLATAEALKRQIPEMKQKGIHFIGILDVAQAEESPGNPGLGVTLP
ncbi:MAG TPA: divergent polysaccharide deacetylase family protein, partial [Paenibacillus sp.]